MRIAVRIAASCGAVVLVLAFAAGWHTALRDVVSYPLSYCGVLGFLVGCFLLLPVRRTATRGLCRSADFLAAGAVVLFIGVWLWWW